MPELPHEMVETAAKALFHDMLHYGDWEPRDETVKTHFREAARGVLQAAHVPDLLEALVEADAKPAQVQEMMRREGFVIDNLDDRWQKLAFTIYSDLVAVASQARAALEKAGVKA